MKFNFLSPGDLNKLTVNFNTVVDYGIKVTELRTVPVIDNKTNQKLYDIKMFVCEAPLKTYLKIKKDYNLGQTFYEGKLTLNYRRA